MEEKGNKLRNQIPLKPIIVLFSYHHHNTEKVAKAMAKVLDAEIKWPESIDEEELQEYDLIGFGSGIYSSKHHESILKLVDKLPDVKDKQAFIFSTSGAPIVIGGQKTLDDYAVKCHSLLREKLRAKGYHIVDEFICAGYNTNSFLKFLGGINKGRPNSQDLENAENFARALISNSMEWNCG